MQLRVGSHAAYAWHASNAYIWVVYVYLQPGRPGRAHDVTLEADGEQLPPQQQRIVACVLGVEPVVVEYPVGAADGGGAQLGEIVLRVARDAWLGLGSGLGSGLGLGLGSGLRLGLGLGLGLRLG